MNQFKDPFLGKEKRAYKRATTSQKCMRVSGKHNDLDNVGPSLRHHTFFEMLGNFSFGDYFKQEAIPFAWELLTTVWQLPPDRLYPTIFKGESGHPARRRGAWRSGRGWCRRSGSPSWAWPRTSGRWATPGPAAAAPRSTTSAATHLPCDEERAGGTCRGLDCSCDRYVEIWNNVFMEFDRQPDGTLKPLPAPSIDTGMGLERITAVIQGKLSNYDTDLFTPILDGDRRARRDVATARRSIDPSDVSMRVIADHLRAMTFLIADGVVPSNEWRGYVLRKIMRRAMRHGKKLGFTRAVPPRARRRGRRGDGRAYPELPAQPRRRRARRAQRRRTVRRGADGRAAATRGGARPRGRSRHADARRRGVPAVRLARRAARLHGGSRRPAQHSRSIARATSAPWRASAIGRARAARSRARRQTSRWPSR